MAFAAADDGLESFWFSWDGPPEMAEGLVRKEVISTSFRFEMSRGVVVLGSVLVLEMADFAIAVAAEGRAPVRGARVVECAGPRC